MGNDNEKIAEKVEEKVEGFEKRLDNQRKELDEKNAKIGSFELRLDELEKKYLDEKKSKDRKIKELEHAVKSKVSDDQNRQFSIVKIATSKLVQKGASMYI